MIRLAIWHWANMAGVCHTYLKQFPLTQLLTLLGEDLEKHPQLVLDAITQYLGS